MANDIFFEDTTNKNAISNILRIISSKLDLMDANALESKQLDKLSIILSYVLENPKSWDYNCQYCINNYKRNLKIIILDISNNDSIDDKQCQILFSYMFVFLKEMELFTGADLHSDQLQIVKFVEENIDSFDSESQSKITFALRNLPTALFKGIFNSPEIGYLKGMNQTISKAMTFTSDWEKCLAAREDSAKKLEESLTKFKNGFNFVGLNQGFEELLNKKIIERRWHIGIMLLIAALIISPLICKMTLLIMESGAISEIIIPTQDNKTPPNITNSMAFLISAISYIGVMLYFFRVSLFHYKSVCAQILQIELRMTLCRFIQHYSEHAAQIKKNSDVTLEKFESVIFSGIVNNDNNLPTTFDGVEQLASLFKSMKNS